MKLKLGTRGSDLARTQAQTIADALAAAGHDVALELIRTSGDAAPTQTFGSIGPQGVFVREIEQALVDGRVDLAVHSFKDLPTTSPDGLVIGAVPPRYDPADLLIARADAIDTAAAADWLPLAHGARVGTASARRRGWLAHFRPDLEITALRGNVPTRLERLGERRCDAILLAAAGIERLRAAGFALDALLESMSIRRLEPERFVPAPAQGALAVQCRAGDAELRAALAALDHPVTRTAIGIERSVLARAEGGCDSAFGAHCATSDAGYELVVMLERDGAMLAARTEGNDPARVAEAAWGALAPAGAGP